MSKTTRTSTPVVLHHLLLVCPEVIYVEAMHLLHQVRISLHVAHHAPPQMGLGCGRNSSHKDLRIKYVFNIHVSCQETNLQRHACLTRS